MTKKIFFAILFCFLAAGTPEMSAARERENTLEVIATIFPTYDFAKNIGGDKVRVTLLLPPGVEAHSFEPRPSDIVKISKADIFIYTGAFMEPWAGKLLGGMPPGAPLAVDAGSDIELEVEEPDAEDHHGHHHHHHHGDKDPHIWTDLAHCQKMVDTIAQGFCEKDPSHCDFYRANAAAYKTKLAELDERFKTGLADCSHRTLIYGGHFAFGYLAARYDLRHISPYRGFSPDAEPTPKALKELIDTLRGSGMEYIYYEELLDPKAARTIAEETGAKLELLHGAHNVSKKELERGTTFLGIMEDNLKKLRAGLECR